MYLWYHKRGQVFFCSYCTSNKSYLARGLISFKNLQILKTKLYN